MGLGGYNPSYEPLRRSVSVAKVQVGWCTPSGSCTGLLGARQAAMSVYLDLGDGYQVAEGFVTRVITPLTPLISPPNPPNLLSPPPPSGGGVAK